MDDLINSNEKLHNISSYLSKNYTVYHLHDDLSLLDSCTKYKDYIDLAVKLGQKAICFSNHGNIYNWIERKMYCDEKGIKYIHGCEIYLTEKLFPKVRDNYHTILIAKNQKGLLELNTLIDLSTQEDHTYYKPRISFDEFLNISDNIIKISSCLASPLNNIDEDNPYFNKLVDKYDYLEIQPHKSIKQISYNEKLYKIHLSTGKPLIVGTDTHSLNEYKSECRSILQKAKNIEYADEDSYDLTYKSYGKLVKCFKEQDTTIPFNVILQAIQNTNVMADSTDDVVLDTSYKYPKLSQDDIRLFKERVYEKCKEKIEKKVINRNKKYFENIQEEIRVLEKIGMCSFMLFMSELLTWCRENGIPYGFARGSVAGSTIAYILDITDVDPVVWNTVFSRFANENRVEIGDIDVDFSPSQRELVFKYIMDRFGKDKSAFILSIGTISDKGTIDEIGRALKYPLDYVDKIKKEYTANSENARMKYSELFYYFDGLINTSISQSFHPAGIVASPVNLYDSYGTFWKDGNRIMQINMEEIHEVNLVKYDILGLKNIAIINDTYKLLGKKYPLSHEINWNDQAVWEDITTSPVSVFQFESDYAFSLLKRFKPKQINDLSLVNASLRPSGASYRDRLINGEFNKNPSEQIDELLKDNKGFLVFQEDTIKFLTEICGMSGSEADNVRRAIGRKDIERLEKALPKILEGYCAKSPKARKIAEEEAKTFLKIIEDSSNYQFGLNHATAYSMIGYMCAYLRYYHPLEFITAYLNNSDTEQDIVDGTNLANIKKIKINPPVFRYSKGKYHPNKEDNSIYKGVGSIKFLNETIGEELYNLRDNKYVDFVELLVDIYENTNCNSRQIEILTKLGFFQEFGKRKYLLEIHEKFISRYKKTYVEKTKVKRLEEIREFTLELENEELYVLDIIKAELEFVGYATYKDSSYKKSIVVVSDISTNNWGTNFATLYRVNDGVSTTLKVNKEFYNEKPFEKMSIIEIAELQQKAKKTKNSDGKFVSTGIFETILTKYARIR